jgi:hypothetical protein
LRHAKADGIVAGLRFHPAFNLVELKLAFGAIPIRQIRELANRD